MTNFIAGKKETLGNNSSKYGYSVDGLCVKAVGGGYRSVNGTYVNTAVSTDASNLVKEATYLNKVCNSQIIVLDRMVFKVLSADIINATTKQFKLLSLETGEISEVVLDTADRIVSVIWDTFENPSKKVDGGIAAISTNEFTPAQLFELRMGRTTLEQLRTPAQVNTIEQVLTDIVRNIVKAGTSQATLEVVATPQA